MHTHARVGVSADPWPEERLPDCELLAVIYTGTILPPLRTCRHVLIQVARYLRAVLCIGPLRWPSNCVNSAAIVVHALERILCTCNLETNTAMLGH